MQKMTDIEPLLREHYYRQQHKPPVPWWVSLIVIAGVAVAAVVWLLLNTSNADAEGRRLETMKCLHEGLAEVSVVKHRQTGVFGVRLVSQAADDGGSVVAVGDDEGMGEKVAQLMVVSLVRHEVASSLLLETDEQLPN